MVENPHQSDIVDEGFDELRGSHVPEGPSIQALEQTLQAVHQAQRKSNRVSLIERIKNMNKLIKYPVAAAIALAAIAGGAYLLWDRSAGIAFADVRQQIEQAQTMTMTATVEMKVLSKPMVMKMYFKSPGLMRQEITMEGNPATAPGTTQPTTAPTAQKAICIFDIANQRGITLIPDQKRATVMELKDLPADVLAGAKEQNFLEELKKAMAGEHEDLGEKTIDGRKVKGYRCKSTSAMKMAMDIWGDAASGKPVLVEQTLPEGMGKVTMMDFVINPKFDDSLFDTRPPEGYKVETQSFNFNVPEEDLIKGVGLFAKYCGGVFPEVLMPTPELVEQLKKAKIKMSKEESQEFGVLASKIMAFRIATMSGGGEFAYAGRGVKLGDKATPILWYKAKDAEAYRVIYGDLHAEDAETAPKPPASRPAPSAGSGQTPSGASTQPR